MHSFLTTSVLSVRENAIKNILFRASTILLQFFILRTFTFIAARLQAYTSYLMFTEDIVQKILYVMSRRFNRQAILVLGFAALISLAGFYDTLLWALDSPGYIIKSKTTNADSLTNDLITSPAYITLISNPTNNVQDINVDAAIAANMFTAGLNFTLPGIVEPGVREIVPPLQPINSSGPRIWLDEDGFSVTAQYISCPVQTLSETTQSWGCWINNTNALTFFEQALGIPQIYWDGQHSDYLFPIRKDNPWESLGTGGDTALMKQVFTVTKDRRRHTFMESVFKTCMIKTYLSPFNSSEISDLLQRTWSLDPDHPTGTNLQTLTEYVLYTQGNETSATFGVFIQQPYTSLCATVEYFNVVNPITSQKYYSALRITSTNITLIRSETLSQAPTPLPCNIFSTNLLTGGQLRGSTCAASLDVTKASYATQLDSSAVMILNDVLGDGAASTSAVAFNQTGWDWYVNKYNHINDVLTSRALILGGNRSAVHVEVQHVEAAISYLQLLLMLLSVFLVSGGAVVVLRAEPMSYYNNSLLAAVCTTTHLTTRECGRVGYLHKPPEITLRRRGRHVLLSTPEGGTLAHVGADQVVAHSMVTEPWTELESSSGVDDQLLTADSTTSFASSERKGIMMQSKMDEDHSENLG